MSIRSEVHVDIASDITWQELRSRFYEIIEGVPFSNKEMKTLIESIYENQNDPNSLLTDNDRKELEQSMELLTEKMKMVKPKSGRCCSWEATEFIILNYRIPDLFGGCNSQQVKTSCEELQEVLEQYRQESNPKYDINQYDIALGTEIARLEFDNFLALHASRIAFSCFKNRFQRMVRRVVRTMFCL